MSTSLNPEYIITQLKRIVESDKRSEILHLAKGGNSILVICEPDSELKYIQSFKKNLEVEKYSLIDLEELLCKFVSENKDDIELLFELKANFYKDIFKSPRKSSRVDLFSLIINSINAAVNKNTIPVLINMGVLYGTGIDNIHIMEDNAVMTSIKPLVILYPGTIEKERIMFLNSRPANNYRCMILGNKNN
jgi:hypothetical protein